MKTAKKGGDAHTMHTQCGPLKDTGENMMVHTKRSQKKQQLKKPNHNNANWCKNKKKEKKKEGEKKNKSV